jgi:hypothetical protein
MKNLFVDYTTALIAGIDKALTILENQQIKP